MRITLLVALFLLIALGGCQKSVNNSAQQASNAQKAAPAAIAVQFKDITQQAGISFKHNNGAFGLSFMPETMGSGVAFLDYDSDGYQDIFFVNSREWTKTELAAYQRSSWTRQETRDFKKNHPEIKTPTKLIPPHRPVGRTVGALYHNNRNGTFTDKTKGSGLDIEMYGMGAAVADYDNDGRPDIYITSYGRNYLFRNRGGDHFDEVAGPLGVQGSGWSTSAAWLDYDKDGQLDLFVCRYVKWSPDIDVYGSADGKHKGYVRPDLYEGQVSHFYHQLNGKFVEIGDYAGIHWQNVPNRLPTPLQGKALGIALCDYNDDKWPDMAVANDTEPNYLYRNNKNGTFSEVGMESGLAFDDKGEPRGGMGIDAADIDHSNRESIAIGNFARQMVGLYYNRGNGLFTDIAAVSGAGTPSLYSVMFGCVFVDYDNDGWPDIALSNGHINASIHIHESGVTYAERPLLLRNQGIGAVPGIGVKVATAQKEILRFQDIGAQCGEVWNQPIIGRGLAYADIDLDGDEDMILTTNGGPALLIRNDGGNKNNAIRLVLQGTKSNRDGIGAVVKCSNEHLRRTVHSGSSYLSQSELPLTIGLGQLKQIEKMNVLWPSGHITRLNNIAANQILTINEDKGLLQQRPFTG